MIDNRTTISCHFTNGTQTLSVMYDKPFQHYPSLMETLRLWEKRNKIDCHYKIEIIGFGPYGGIYHIDMTINSFPSKNFLIALNKEDRYRLRREDLEIYLCECKSTNIYERMGGNVDMYLMDTENGTCSIVDTYRYLKSRRTERINVHYNDNVKRFTKKAVYRILLARIKHKYY